jgi:septum formation protein
MPLPLVLASASPRRRDLLAQLGIAFEVVPSDVAEEARGGESPAAFAMRVAREKALAVARQRSHQWVLAADTIVVIDGDVLGKPTDRAEACAMLRRLRERTHHVLTAVVLAAPDGPVRDECITDTAVTMRAISDDEIDRYVATGEPFDKAGGYGIQGRASPFVTETVGSYTNVIGLPLDEVRALLQRRGLLSGDAKSTRA